MTGDRDAVAAKVAHVVGITSFWSGVTPAGKADLIKGLQQEGEIVAMVSCFDVTRLLEGPKSHAHIDLSGQCKC